MDNRLWMNNRQTQTLYIAQFLLYFDAVFGFLGYAGIMNGAPVISYLGYFLGLGAVLAMAAGANGIANNDRWGYYLALGVSSLTLLVWAWLVIRFGFRIVSRNIISLMFDGALFVALIHPTSRAYQKLWFK